MLHPTQKPVALLRALLSQYCKPVELVLDPFAGSGSTLVTAQELGLCSLGIELTEQYYNIAKERINNLLYPHAGHARATSPFSPRALVEGAKRQE